MTLSTVGYGDFSPNTRLHQAFTIMMIITGVAFLLRGVRNHRDERRDRRDGSALRSRFRSYHILGQRGDERQRDASDFSRGTLALFPPVLAITRRRVDDGGRARPDLRAYSPLRSVFSTEIHPRFPDGSNRTFVYSSEAEMAFVLGNLSALDSASHAEDEHDLTR